MFFWEAFRVATFVICISVLSVQSTKESPSLPSSNLSDTYIILRPSEEVYFYVHRVILAMVPSVLKEMIALSPPSHDG
ncbi:hypothetical protein AcV7_003042 [Taiwanofungus camphoratus]|nr:hypothetical protein AcV7_003042 [Antrodia cinnamomea]